jgi:BlaI family transcriptional regulator, penicillinase repressor
MRKLTKLEMQIMEALWSRGTISIREIQEAFPERTRPAYTTIQTTVYRLEAKQAVRRVKKVGNFHVFAAAISRDAAQRRLIDDLLALFDGHAQPVMAHLIESGKLTLEDVKEAEKTLRQLARKPNLAKSWRYSGRFAATASKSAISKKPPSRSTVAASSIRSLAC